MSAIEEAIETIIIYKGNQIKDNIEYNEYIERVLNEHGIISSETTEQTVEDFVKAFKIGSVDGMAFDVAAALDFTHSKARDKRRDILKKIFLEE